MRHGWAVKILCGALLWLSVLAPPVFPKEGSPRLWRRVEVPKELLSQGGWAGDLRIGDLDGDGQVDFLVFRSADEGMKPCFLGAFSLSGRVLWQDGSGGDQPARPGRVVIHDLDGNGTAEVVSFFLDRARKATAASGPCHAGRPTTPQNHCPFSGWVISAFQVAARVLLACPAVLPPPREG